jgi:hypothetical protein
MDRQALDRLIKGFHPDPAGDWVAELDCGHNQHVRHRPPMQWREWVLDPALRAARIGTIMDCPLCDRDQPAAPPDDGGSPACLVGLVCSDCDGVAGDGPGHRAGCPRLSG